MFFVAALVICLLQLMSHVIYPNNTRDVYLYIYSVSAYMGWIEGN